MPNTLGVHWTTTTHGTWVHGDWRGSWRQGQLIGPDPFLEETIRQHMTADAVVLDRVEQVLVATAFGRVIRQRGYRAYAAAIRGTHAHVVFGPLYENIMTVYASLRRRASADGCARRRQMQREVPRHLWTSGRFPVYIFDEDHLHNAINYVRQHNLEIGLPADPYDWIEPLYPP
jgi:hypothetical protein